MKRKRKYLESYAIILGIIICLAFVALSHCETGYIYLIYRSSFPVKAQFDNLVNNGRTNSKIPIIQTRTLTCPNTNYAYHYVSYDENTALETMYQGFETPGRIQLLKKVEYKSEIDPIRGGYWMTIDFSQGKREPSDVNRVWVVGVST